jgi:hypothetical protein
MDRSPEVKTVVASLPYPIVGGSQHRVIIRHQGSEVPSNPDLYLDWKDIPRTVLAGAFGSYQVVVPTPLSAPNDLLTLPPLRRSEFRERLIRDAHGRAIGYLCEVPGLFVHANQALKNYLLGNEGYNYSFALMRMVEESARLLSSVLRQGAMRIRQKPGLMAHAQDVAELGFDEVGISVAFAKELFDDVRPLLPLEVSNVWELDGMPVWGIRFPVANEWGVQEMILRILPGRGDYIGFNPWTLGQRFLGDSDGDLGFVLPRIEELRECRDFHTNEPLFMQKRPRVIPKREITVVTSRLSLQGIADPRLIEGLSEKEAGRMETPDFHTVALRLQSIRDADTRGHVAVYTMMAWWVARTLATADPKETGLSGPQEAYKRAYSLLEWFMENCMDARKGDSALSGGIFDSNKFMRILMNGARPGQDINFKELERLGVPPKDLETLRMSWRISKRDLRCYCARSPVYLALVLGRRNMEDTVIDMLYSLIDVGVEPAEVYRVIVDDLTCKSPIFSTSWNNRTRNSANAGLKA